MKNTTPNGPIEPQGYKFNPTIIIIILIALGIGAGAFFFFGYSIEGVLTVDESEKEAVVEKEIITDNVAEGEVTVPPDPDYTSPYKAPNVIDSKISKEFDNKYLDYGKTGYENHQIEILHLISDSQIYNFAVNIPIEWMLQDQTDTMVTASSLDNSQGIGIVAHPPDTVGFQEYTNCMDYITEIGLEPTFLTTTLYSKEIEIDGNLWERVYYTYDASGISGVGMDQCYKDEHTFLVVYTVADGEKDEAVQEEFEAILDNFYIEIIGTEY